MKNKNKDKSSINGILNKKSNFKLYELILFATLIIILSVFSTVLVMSGLNGKETSKISIKNNNSNYLSEFEEVYELINDSYYKNVNKNDLIDGAINGMLQSLNDPHTSYFSKAETENFNELMNGSYEGIGAEISINSNGEVFISSIFKNSPASEVGLKFNDVII